MAPSFYKNLKILFLLKMKIHLNKHLIIYFQHTLQQQNTKNEKEEIVLKYKGKVAKCK